MALRNRELHARNDDDESLMLFIELRNLQCLHLYVIISLT